MTPQHLRDLRTLAGSLLVLMLASACGGGGGREDAGEEADAELDEAGDPDGDGSSVDAAAEEADGDGAEDTPIEGEADLPVEATDADGVQDIETVDGEGDAEGEGETCECASNEDCDTGNPCVMSLCSPTTCLCYDYDLPDDTPCPDDVFCNGVELCAAGSCVAATSPACKPAAECMQVTCDEASDACDEGPAPDGTSCDDGSWCTGADTCSDGVCEHSPRCTGGTGNPCTRYRCNESAHACDEATMPDGEECDDGSACTFSASCRAGLCIALETACDDAVPCSIDHCAPDGGGHCVEVTVCP
jgi:hypothetical protein